jgi:SAM-dependent methyltransferase
MNMGRIRRVLGRMASRLERLLRPDDDLIPPLHLRWRYFGTARRDAYLYLTETLPHELLSRGLQPSHRVLDVGCGLGPLAVGLIPYLTGGTYEGVDVHAEAISWCQHAIAARYPQFRFRHADLANTTYNPRGKVPAAAYRFPYDDNEFDVALLSSICTHLPAADASHYLREVARVLKPGGRCVAGFYLLNDESLPGIDAGRSFLPFIHAHDDGCSRVVDPHNPAAAIAHAEDDVQKWFDHAGLQIDEPIRRGRWWDGVAHSQDVLAAAKPAN